MKVPSSERMYELSGVGLVSGVAGGTAFRVDGGVKFYRLHILPGEVDSELARFRNALEEARKQLEDLKSRLLSQLGNEPSLVLDAHLLVLQDPYFLNSVQTRIVEQLESPERAVRETCEEWKELYRGLNDPFFRGKDSDLAEVAERVTSNLLESGPEPSVSEEAVVLVGDFISLSSLADFRPGQVAALVTTQGGPASHLAIVARACHLPLVAGIEQVERYIRTGDGVIVDGSKGIVRINPPRAEIERLERRKRRPTSMPEPVLPRHGTFTRDGRQIHLFANTEVTADLVDAQRSGAEGIGLFRCEHLYLGRRDGPISQQLQREIYADLARQWKGRPVFIRTVDMVDSGHSYFVRLAGEAEPLLGLRGIRLSLRYPEIFRAQVSAIMQASTEGDLRIVLPMVTSVEEIRGARRIIQEAYRDLKAAGEAPAEIPDVGVMVEVPAAVLAIESIASESDFLLVGTNDLMQYTLAVGRNNQRLSDLFNPFHPAILLSLQRIIETAERQQRLAVVCGEAATWPGFSEVLLGLGFRHLSMSPAAIPSMSQHLEQLRFSSAQELVQKVLKASSTEEVEQLMKEVLSDHSPLKAELH